MIPGSANALLLASAAAGGYQISRSLRFNSSDSAYLSRTPNSAGTSYTTWTFSCWVKRANLGAQQGIIAAGTNTSDYFHFKFTSGDALNVLTGENGATNQNNVSTVAVFRDAGAWYHIVLQWDFTNATQSDRLKIFVNGDRQTLTGSVAAQNYAGTTFNRASIEHCLGRVRSGVEHFNGYLAEIHFIDGQALTPSSFTEVSATTGQLIPKTYTGSFGTNGFWLKFSDNSNNTATTLGKDYSSNNNNWTPVNLSPFSGTVDSAGGAKPVQNTTDAYGFIAGSGARTDSLSANLQIALPLYTSITDLSPSALATTSTTGNTALTFQTSTFKFYGGSMVSTSTGSSYGTRVNFNSTISLPSGGWTVEFFAKVINISPNGNSITVKNGSSAILDLYHYGSGNSYLIEVYFSGTSTRISGYNTASNYLDWNHYAICYNGTTATLYINGISTGTNSSNIPTQATNFELAGTGWSGNTSYVTDFRIYSTAKYTGNFSIPNRTIAAGNDSLVDTPTSYGTDTGAGGEVRGNYATFNPLDLPTSGVYSNGNLEFNHTGGSGVWRTGLSTFAVSSGKWYWEMVPTVVADSMIGIVKADWSPTANSSQFWDSAGGYGYLNSNGNKYNNGSSASYGATFTTNDVIGVALDLDAGTLVFYKNGVSQGTAYSSLSGTFKAAFGAYQTCKGIANFGQRPFAYTAPSGFKALCDTNLPAPVVAKPSTVMDVVLYTGNSTDNRAITGLGFSPDLVWFGPRSQSGQDKVICDSVRGVQKALFSNQTYVEANPALYGSVGSFDSAGFTIKKGTDATFGFHQVNLNSSTYAAWCWDAGSSTVTLNPGDPGAGSITGGSQVRANPSAGFSIVSYTSTGGTATVGHGLGIAPSMVITKGRNVVSAFITQHISLAANNVLYLNGTDASQDVSGNGSLPKPTSTVFSVNNQTGSNGGTYNMIAYCFAPVAGYSSGFSYTGNGSTDGSFVYLGFRPRLILLKCSSTTGNWTLLDAAREGYNVDNDPLYPNLSDAEGTTDLLDITSNGFKLRTTDASVNSSGATYVGYAWAEAPFAYSRAR